MSEAARQEIIPAAERMVMTPMEMLDRAVSQGAEIAVLEKLMALSERYEANKARRAFDEAMADAKAEIPTIVKNRTVSYESKGSAKGTEYRHEDLAEIARTVDPILSKHGLSYRWRTESAVGQPIKVTCVVSHRAGHFEENTLLAGRDESGSKNAIQSIGSTLSYLSRYTLKAALGLAASNDDDGSMSAHSDESISDEQFAKLRQLMVDTGANEVKFLAYFKIDDLAELPAKQFDRAIAALEAKRAK
jgi:hypothetical protein